MQFYAGIDLHSNNNVLVILDQNGQRVFQKRLPNDISAIKHNLAAFGEPLKDVVLESTYNWYWLGDGLRQANYEVHLANTAANKPYSGIKYTDDLSDAHWLAELLRTGNLAEGHICPPDIRSWRDLARRRMQLVRERTRQILFMESLWTRLTGQRISRQEFHQTNWQEMSKELPLALQISLKSGQTLLNQYEQQIELVEKQLFGYVGKSPIYMKLQTIWGVGKILALVIWLEIWDINRFKSAGHLASYCCCVGGGRLSNQKKKGNNNYRNGNRYLAWAMIEAANYADMHYPQARAFVSRKTNQKNRALGIKALANKLAHATYFVWRDQMDFDPNRLFGSTRMV